MSNSEHPLELETSPNDASLPEAWTYLEEGLRRIMAGTTLSYKEYSGMYAMVYRFCNDPRVTLDGKHPCSDLYGKIVAFLTAHVEKIRERISPLQGDDLLKIYSEEWNYYATRIPIAHRVFEYLNRNWIRQEMKKQPIYPINTLAFVQWNTFVLRRIQQPLTAATLDAVERERGGETIDHESIKKVLESFVAVDINPKVISSVNYREYREHFEKPFLKSTEKFYIVRRDKSLANLDRESPEYGKQVEEWVHEEESRAERYLDGTTKKKLVGKCREVLLGEQETETERRDDNKDPSK